MLTFFVLILVPVPDLPVLILLLTGNENETIEHKSLRP